jgi:16S rRNA (guanine966-N2)-methyltransferase
MAAAKRNQIRIIAGHWRGRRLDFSPAPGLRPTPARVRETLFNWLTPDLPGARCLDLFAGSARWGWRRARAGRARWCWSTAILASSTICGRS